MVRTEVFAFSGSNRAGHTNRVSVFAPDGRQPFSLHRLSGVRELPQAGSPYPGGEFFAEPQRGGDSPSADGGNVPRPAAGQEGRHQGFYPLNSHFLLVLGLVQIADM